MSEAFGAMPRKIGLNRTSTAAPRQEPATPQPWHQPFSLTLPALTPPQ